MDAIREERAFLAEMLTSFKNDLDKRLDKLDEKAREADAKLTAISDSIKEVKIVRQEMVKVKAVQERMWKKMLSNTVIIHGMKDSEKETTEGISLKVSAMAQKIGASHLDIDMIRRMGKFKPGKNRLLEVTVVRHRQKLQLMKAKAKLKEKQDTKEIFINEAMTPGELQNFYELLKFAKRKKNSDESIQFHFIGNQILDIQGNTIHGKFHVDEAGQVVVWKKEVPMEGTDGAT